MSSNETAARRHYLGLYSGVIEIGESDAMDDGLIRKALHMSSPEDGAVSEYMRWPVWGRLADDAFRQGPRPLVAAILGWDQAIMKLQKGDERFRCSATRPWDGALLCGPLLICSRIEESPVGYHGFGSKETAHIVRGWISTGWKLNMTPAAEKIMEVLQAGDTVSEGWHEYANAVWEDHKLKDSRGLGAVH